MRTKIINSLLVLAIVGICGFLVFLLKDVWQFKQLKATNSGSTQVILTDKGKTQSVSFSKRATTEELNSAIDKALNFLAEEQSSKGGFSVCINNNQQDCHNEQQPPIIAAQILISLHGVSGGEKLISLKQKAVRFLLNSQGKDGLWKFYDILPPDLNDTSLASLALKLNNQDFIPNIEQFMSSRDRDGIFETWVFGKDGKSRNDPSKQDIDCVINMNILTYLAKMNFDKKEVIGQVCDYFNPHLVSKQSCSKYYPSRVALLYSASRAADNGISCILEKKETIIQETIKSFNRKDGNFGDETETAFAINILLELGYRGDETDRAIQYLLQNQNQKGGFKSDVIATDGGKTDYYSPAFSTAIAVEALARHQRALR